MSLFLVFDEVIPLMCKIIFHSFLGIIRFDYNVEITFKLIFLYLTDIIPELCPIIMMVTT